MKKLYWRPHKVSRVELLFVTVFALGALFVVERFKISERQDYYDDKVAAARVMARASQMIVAEKGARGIQVDPDADPIRSGLIGSLLTPVTSNTGHLEAKQTSVNPNFAAVIVHYLRRAGVQEGDLVAVGVSGSFPGLNLATYSALQVIKAEPIIIASVSASEWGANDPNLLWVDMERILKDRGILGFRSIAASRGGVEDKGLGMSKEGREAVDRAIERNGLPRIYPASFADSIEQRMKIYQERAAGRPFKAYINIGGGVSSVGSSAGKKLFRPGLNRSPPRGIADIDGVMSRFSLDGVPVIHLTQIMELARTHGLPLNPMVPPAIGEGRIYVRAAYNVWLAGGAAAIIILLLMAVIRTDWGFRLLRMNASRSERKPPEQMV